jgi:site-specific DNA-methyltransferase (adenine-specific)
MKNLLQGNNIELLKTLEPNSIDSVVTDPPYGLSFMNKKWDYDVPSVEFWKEVYRVLKPGGHILSFGGTRTYHRMVVAIEDAGFEIRDQIQWIYGSGFPKSLNIGKAIDKMEGNEREVIKEEVTPYKVNNTKDNNIINEGTFANNFSKEIDDNGYRIKTISKGNSVGEGWGTGLKPANEPIVLARKPISENTIAENFMKWNTGGINIDESRVNLEKGENTGRNNKEGENGWKNSSGGKNENKIREENNEELLGRFPANIILECTCDEVINGDTGDIHTDPNCPCRLMNDQSGELKTKNGGVGKGNSINNGSKTGMKGKIVSCFDDKGGASRFFYSAKVSKAERNMGLDGFPLGEPRQNNHPTIKPVQLMYYLCNLITPKGGVILDPYMGSGSTGIAAKLGGFIFIGMEQDVDYFNIAKSRINNYEQYQKFLKK